MVVPCCVTQVWEKLGSGYMRFSGAGEHDPLGYIIENRVLVAALADELHRLKGTTPASLTNRLEDA